MAPISPDSTGSRKRSSPHSDDGSFEEPQTKRRRFQKPNTPPPENKTSGRPMFNDDPHQLLLRSIALTCEHVGFSGADPEALEAFCAQAETYAAQFLSKITSSMLNARRSLPTPVDFQYALAKMDLPIASIEPHLRPPVPKSKLLIHLDALPEEDLPTATLPGAEILLGNELSGEADKKAKKFIPKRFPTFPSKHTYKWTEKESARVTDPRKIREESAKTARLNEESLRKLTRASKVGKEKDIKRAASKDPRTKERYEKWEQTMEDLFGKKSSTGKATGQEDDQSMIVNADKRFMRKGALARRKPQPPIIELQGVRGQWTGTGF